MINKELVIKTLDKTISTLMSHQTDISISTVIEELNNRLNFTKFCNNIPAKIYFKNHPIKSRMTQPQWEDHLHLQIELYETCIKEVREKNLIKTYKVLSWKYNDKEFKDAFFDDDILKENIHHLMESKCENIIVKEFEFK